MTKRVLAVSAAALGAVLLTACDTGADAAAPPPAPPVSTSAAPTAVAVSGPAPASEFTDYCYVPVQYRQNDTNPGMCAQVPKGWTSTKTNVWQNVGREGRYYLKQDFHDKTGSQLLRFDTNPKLDMVDSVAAMGLQEETFRKDYPQYHRISLTEGGITQPGGTTKSAQLDFTFAKDGVQRRVHVTGMAENEEMFVYVYYSAPADQYDRTAPPVVQHATKITEAG
jgi:hypothetical protein